MSEPTDPVSQPTVPASVRSIERCIDIFDLLVPNDRAMSLTEIAAAIDAPKSTVLMILRTLAGRGLVGHDSKTKLYHIGLGFTRYADKTQVEVRLKDLAVPHLQALVDETTETVTLAMTDGLAVYYLCRIMGSHPLQYVIPVGTPRPMHATASGKVLLAHMMPAERQMHYQKVGLAGLTERTITQVTKLEEQLEICKEVGYATASGESCSDLFGIAAPIFESGGSAIAAVNLGGPLSRLADQKERYVKNVVAAAEAITVDLRRVGRDGAMGAVSRWRCHSNDASELVGRLGTG